MHHNHFEAIQCVQKLSYLLHKDDYDARRRVRAPAVHRHPARADHDRERPHPASSSAPRTATGRTRVRSPARSAPPSSPSSTCSYVIAGHSERRELFGETDEWVNKKVKAVLAHGMTPIMCVGETLDEREAGSAESKVDGQVRSRARRASPRDQVGDMVIAYEPIWAIGTGRTATPEDAQAVCSRCAIRRQQLAGADAAASRPRAVRRVGQAGQHRRVDGAARHRRCPGRRGQPRPRELRRHRPRRPSIAREPTGFPHFGRVTGRFQSSDPGGFPHLVGIPAHRPPHPPIARHYWRALDEVARVPRWH